MQGRRALQINLLLLLFSFSSALNMPLQGFNFHKCDCNVYTNPYNCYENCNGEWCALSDCKWDGQSCQNLECDEFISRIQCDLSPKCYVNRHSQYCEEFTSCEQLSEQYNGCGKKNCYPTGTGYCSDKPQNNMGICSQMMNEDDCRRTQLFNFPCLWLNGSCNLFSCSLIEQDLCEKLKVSCFYENNKCRQRICSDYKNEMTCKDIIDFETASTIMCIFSQNQCVNPTLEQLDSDELCAYASENTYTFKDGKCQECGLWKSQKILECFLIFIIIFGF